MITFHGREAETDTAPMIIEWLRPINQDQTTGRTNHCMSATNLTIVIIPPTVLSSLVV